MSQSNMQKIYQILVFVMLIGLSISRPNGSTDNQDPAPSTTLDNQLGMADFEKSFQYRQIPSPQYINYEEPSQYQMQYRSFVAPNAPVFRGGGGGSASMPLWDSYRQFVSKRQARYRQCYFNPISCFRK